MPCCSRAARRINPSAGEVCNGVDDNCDGRVDDGALMNHADHDGYGTGAAMQSCFVTTGRSFLGNDCPAVVPGAMICASRAAYQICDQQGQFGLEIACPNQQQCRTQPNGLGVCLQRRDRVVL